MIKENYSQGKSKYFKIHQEHYFLINRNLLSRERKKKKKLLYESLINVGKGKYTSLEPTSFSMSPEGKERKSAEVLLNVQLGGTN